MKHAKEEDGRYADMIINVPFSSSNIKTLCLSLYIFFLSFVFSDQKLRQNQLFLSAEMEMLVGPPFAVKVYQQRYTPLLTVILKIYIEIIKDKTNKLDLIAWHMANNQDKQPIPITLFSNPKQQMMSGSDPKKRPISLTSFSSSNQPISFSFGPYFQQF